MSRPCPNCKVGQVKCAEIPSDSICPHCHKRVEVNFLITGIASIGILALELLLFYLDFAALGIICFGFFSVFVAYYKRITTHYFPLKVYD